MIYTWKINSLVVLLHPVPNLFFSAVNHQETVLSILHTHTHTHTHTQSQRFSGQIKLSTKYLHKESLQLLRTKSQIKCSSHQVAATEDKKAKSLETMMSTSSTRNTAFNSVGFSDQIRPTNDLACFESFQQHSLNLPIQRR